MNLETFELATKFIENKLRTGCVLVEKVSEYTNYSARQLDRIFEEYAGCTVTQYIRRRKISLALSEYYAKRIPINVIANKYNYDAAAFSRATRSEYGFSPKEYLKKAQSAELFPPIDAADLKEEMEKANEAMDSLEMRGFLKLKRNGNKVAVKLEQRFYNEMSNYVRSLPPIPIPVQLLMHFDSHEQLVTVIGVSLYEYRACQYNVDQMEWDVLKWQGWCCSPSDELLLATEEVGQWYSLDSAISKGNSDIVWFSVDPIKTHPIHLIAAGDKMKKNLIFSK